jgi:hypothetical protein
MRSVLLAFTVACTVMLPALAIPSQNDTSEPRIHRLSNGKVEAEVSLSPHPRILSYNEPGMESQLLPAPAGEHAGLRLIAIELLDGRQRNFAFSSPARLVEGNETMVLLETEAGEGEDTVGLRLHLILEDGTARLKASCTISNKGTKTRTLAPWAIASLTPKGWMVTNVTRGIENDGWEHARITGYWGSSLADPCLRPGTDALAIDFSRWNGTSALKYGTRTNAGWLAAIRPDLARMLFVTIPYSSNDVYPDEDCNATLWAGDRRGELEWLGPWQQVPAGESLNWEFTWELREAPADTTLAADDYVKYIRAASRYADPSLNASMTSSDVWVLDARGPLTRDSFHKVTEWFSPDGKTSTAVAPLWYNAPRLSPEGGALVWTRDTLVEARSDSLPPWDPRGRSWVAIFRPSERAVKAPTLLLQEGGIESGFALFLAGGHLEAALWSDGTGEPKIARVKTRIEPDQNLAARAVWDPEKNEFRLYVGKVNLQPGDGATLLRTHLPDGLKPSPKSWVGIGRNASLPPQVAPEKPSLFEGSIRRIQIGPKDAE